jgi:receptor protein-tyrosine kinase
MSRVHDALRKAAQNDKPLESARQAPRVAPPPTVPPPAPFFETPPAAAPVSYPEEPRSFDAPVNVALDLDDLEAVIRSVQVVPYNPSKEALLVSPANPREAPAEEFRTIRTRLNHMQTLQPLHTLVVTSASPAEGKSFTAMNLAVTQSQLADKRVLLADFDFRRPTVDRNFQIPATPGITNYLTGKAPLEQAIKKIEGTNLYVLPAGEPVPNPLELLNLKECRALIDGLRSHFDWVILDSPPLLFAADGNLLATMCDGTLLVVRIGTTTFDSVTRALQSLCENNVLGVVVNGARRGELYSKYTYYHDYYYAPEAAENDEAAGGSVEQEEAVES